MHFKEVKNTGISPGFTNAVFKDAFLLSVIKKNRGTHIVVFSYMFSY